MNNQPTYLLIGGIASLLIALLHIVLAIQPQLYRYFNAGQLAEMHEQGSSFTVLVTIGLAIMFTGWSAYAFSGVQFIKPLPLMRIVLTTIGVIYILRGLMLPGEILKVIRDGYPFRFIILSSGSLIIGLLHLFGIKE